MSEPRRRMPREERAAQLITIARAVFAEKGFATATIDEIAELAGITKPVIYDHFGSKDGVLEAVIAQGNDRLTQGLVQRMAALGPNSTAADVYYAHCLGWFDFVDTYRESFAVMTLESGVRDNPRLNAAKAQHMDALAGLLSGFPEFAELDAGEIHGYVHMIVAATQELGLWFVGQSSMTVWDAADMLWRMVWNGLLGFNAPTPRERVAGSS